MFQEFTGRGLANQYRQCIPDCLTQRLIVGHLNIAFMLETRQFVTIKVHEVAKIHLLMISSYENQLAAEALAADYNMVDWGLAHAPKHRRLCPDAPEHQLREAQVRMVLTHMLELDGVAYLPGPMVIEEVHEGQFFQVADAEPIDRDVYAVYPGPSEKQSLLDKVLEYRLARWRFNGASGTRHSFRLGCSLQLSSYKNAKPHNHKCDTREQ